MLSILYPFSFFVSLFGLIMWFYYQGHRQMSRLMSTAFLGGFMVYLFSLAFSDAEFSYKLLILFRDLMVLAIVSQFFSFFRKNKAVFFAMLAVLYGSFHFKGFDYWQQTFPQTSGSASLSRQLLDPDAELLLELKETHQISELQSLADQYGLSMERAFHPNQSDGTELDDYYLINIPTQKASELQAIKSALQGNHLVDWVEDNEQILVDPKEVASYRRSPIKRPYSINDPGLGQLWGFDEMQVEKLYKYINNESLKATKKARIFILDTGIDAAHEDLADNYRSVKKKYDNDPVGHGTHCAGIAAAVSNNAKGIASFSLDNQFVEVSSIKVLNGFGGGTQTTIINGIIEAADSGADVISLSLGGLSNDSRQRAYEKAVQYANKAGAIVIAAAGNSNRNARSFAPANTPGIITVAAIDTQLNRASFSNFVTDLDMGIAAPGVGIYSTVPGDKYTFFNGTSMATPYVAGLVGLMKSLKPGLTTEEAYTILKNSGKATGAPRETGNFIQPAAAIELLLK